MRHLPVPRVTDVVVLPVIAYYESDDADTDGGTVVDHRNILALIEIDDVTGIYPAPMRPRNDIAPAVILHAALNSHCEPASQDRHYRIVFGGSGMQGDSLGGISHLGICRDRKEEH